MPVGPEGQSLYTVDEAYDVMGRRQFAHEWERRYSRKPAIPDLAYLRKHAEHNLEGRPPEIRQFLETDPAEADRMQVQLRRENAIFDDLINALLWGKADCWHKKAEWQLVPVFDWYDKTPARTEFIRTVKAELVSILRDNTPPRQRLYIDKDKLDRWIGWGSGPDRQSPLVKEPRPANRPPADWASIRTEFHRRCETGQVRDTDRGWRTCEARALEEWTTRVHPGAANPVVETIRKTLKPEFDAYEGAIADKVAD